MAEFLDDYYAECDEHLASIRGGLLAFLGSDGMPVDRFLLDGLLRAFHSIKGLSGMMGIGAAERLSHAIEGELRRWGQAPTVPAERVDLLMAASTLLEEVIVARRTGQEAPDIYAMVERLTASEEAPDPAERLRAGSPGNNGLVLDEPAAARLNAALARGSQAWRCRSVSSAEAAGVGDHGQQSPRATPGTGRDRPYDPRYVSRWRRGL